MSLQLDDLALLDAPASGVDAGKPLLLAVDLIDEDPSQPRSEFDPEALQQLADTIAQRGVRQPISVRPHPEQPGRWLVNFGARRLRASKMAGKIDIPAFVDATADTYDQVIENEQRENLKPLELALFVQKQMSAGVSQAEIAKRLGKTRGYLTFIGALIDAPDWLLGLYRSGRCRGITELYELRRLHEERPEAVEEWSATKSHIARADVQTFKESLKQVELAAGVAPIRDDSGPALAAMEHHVGPAPSVRTAAAQHSPAAPSAKQQPAIPARRSMSVLGEVDGATVEVLFDTTPTDPAQVFVHEPDGKQPKAVAMASIRGLRLVRG